MRVTLAAETRTIKFDYVPGQIFKILKEYRDGHGNERVLLQLEGTNEKIIQPKENIIRI